eukprot:TRINITY_DN21464_c0_g1_i1.p1 TRINITY_DN21464_c0_g1~~TRINITY_DN21464_c0_g1_i1.p1  ORF type:complete len:287 (+),score=21.31 TRINITY_DN21464_c0_g1_i1:58-918(+)
MFVASRSHEKSSRWAVPLLLLSSGTMFVDSYLWYETLAYCFAAIWCGLVAMCTLTIAVGEFGRMEKCQPTKNNQFDMMKIEIWEMTTAAFVAATLSAWPMGKYRLGEDLACTSDLEVASHGFGREVGFVIIALKMLGVILAADAYLYWKHRILHSRSFYVFHKSHHQFFNPSPFAGFAVAPVEALITFGPILMFCIPEFAFYTPVHMPGIFIFVFLNFYLHAGYRVPLLEKVLPVFFINTSSFHNAHHEKTHTHFGEMLTLWDYLLGTDTGFLDLKTGWKVIQPNE